MAIKDKLVDLEDLKALKDWIVERMDMYEDITSSLTWNNATWIVDNGDTKKTSTEAITGVKVAKVSVDVGDSFKVHSWYKGEYTGNGYNYAYPAVLVDSSDNIMDCKAGKDGVPIKMTGVNAPNLHFAVTEVTIPSSVRYMYIFNYAGHTSFGKPTGDIVVKKAL